MQIKNTWFTAAISLIIVCHSLAYADWESIGPYGGPVGCMALAPSNDAIVYAATSPMLNPSNAGICQSLDTAKTWAKKGNFAGTCLSLAVSPSDPNLLIAGDRTGIFRSTDAGGTWTAYSVGGTEIYGLEFHPTTPSIVYAAGKMPYSSYTVMAFFKSTNSGLNWTATPLHTVNNGTALSLAVDRTNPNTVYIGGNISGSPNITKVYKTTNGGTSFTDVSNGFSALGYPVNALKVHPTNPNIVYSTNFYEGIYRTTNGGTNWALVFSGIFFTNLAASPASPNTAYAGKDTLIYKTTNGGATWFIAGTGYGGVYKLPRSLVAGQSMGNLLYTGDNVGVSKSLNGGASWTLSNNGMTLAHITNFLNAPSAPWILYTEFEGVGVHKTTNSGIDWSLLPTPLACGIICQFAVHNANPNFVMGLEGTG